MKKTVCLVLLHSLPRGGKHFRGFFATRVWTLLREQDLIDQRCEWVVMRQLAIHNQQIRFPFDFNNKHSRGSQGIYHCVEQLGTGWSYWCHRHNVSYRLLRREYFWQWKCHICRIELEEDSARRREIHKKILFGCGCGKKRACSPKKMCAISVPSLQTLTFATVVVTAGALCLLPMPPLATFTDSYGNLRQFRSKSAVYHAGEHREVVASAQPVRSSNSAPYRRATYWAERISQWRQNEPPIGDDDWQTISHAYIAATSDGPMKKWDLTYVLCKDDIRELLRSCDKQLEARLLRTRFVRRYLVSFSVCNPASVLAM
jgi:hypothetical protein